MSNIQDNTRLADCFADLAAKQKKALVAYFCMGYPTLEESIDHALIALDAGADILELGVPFSDAVADGPVIAKASQQAINQGSSITKVIEAAAKISERTSAPLVLFTYFNPLFVHGPSIIESIAKAGIDALLIVDLPSDEGEDFRQLAKAHNIAIIPLITPTSTAERVVSAKEHGSGFIYYVSVTGITGSAQAPLAEACLAAEKIQSQTSLPVVVGFGIDSPEKAKVAAGSKTAGANGVVVGTALIKTVQSQSDHSARQNAVRQLIQSLRQALD